MPNDLSPETHALLDTAAVSFLSSLGITEPAAVAAIVTILSQMEYRNVWPIDLNMITPDACKRLLDSRPDIQTLLQNACTTGRYAQIRNLPEFHTKEQQPRYAELDVLRKAYNKPYLGKAAHDFVNYLLDTEKAFEKKLIYAKAVSVVQSSGTGKSRMLTEAGKAIFTLPICVRHPSVPGYPPSDRDVYDYFTNLHNRNDLSVGGHASIACFLGAAHSTMLKWLRNAYPGRTPGMLLDHWNSGMEQPTTRANFFKEVVTLAKSMDCGIVHHMSPKRNDKGEPDRPDFNVTEVAKKFYEEHMKSATKALTAFVCKLFPQTPLVLTYFDEAHELQLSYWMLLRLASSQGHTIPMWYVFMGTHSSITYLSPAPRDVHSLQLRQEIERLLEPYIALGFDQNLISENPQATVRMGYLHSIEHLSRYGRPMWHAQFLEGEGDILINLACLKLAGLFRPQNRDHVLAVLSQRVCVDTVLVSAEALQLADRSVANHMRLLTGFSHNERNFLTHSQSEPILALGAARLVNNAGNPVLGQVLTTFRLQLCEAGLVEKGLLGELASRILLTVARDLVAPTTSDGPNLLKPVLLMDFLDELFGNKKWCDPCRQDFDNAFGDTYVNFTHWVVTKDPLPGEPSQRLLANLWARGVALQCCFHQESLDLVIVTYKGSVAANAIFDVENLSAIVIQIKYKGKADTKAVRALRPIGIPRSIRQPLPYIALLMELDDQSNHQSTKSKFLVTASPLEADGTFGTHWKERESAMKELFDYKVQKEKEKEKEKRQKKKSEEDPQETESKKKVDDAQAKMDACNRFSISVRGASPEVYGALHKAKITEEFVQLLSVTMTTPTDQDTTMKYMRPLERLDETSDYTAWMSVYVRGEGGEVAEEDSLMDVDS